MKARNFAIAALSLFVLWAVYFLYLTPFFSQASTEQYVVKGMTECYEGEFEKKCLMELSVNLLERFSLPEILAVFREHESEEAFFRTCHEEAHYLGREAYRRLGSVAKVYAQSNETCLGGVFHGALEGYFIESDLVLGQDNFANIRSAVSNICKEVEAETPHSFDQCHHGLGHALMFAAEDSLVDALSLCDALETVSEREGCYTGAFMQNVVNQNSQDHPTAMFKANDPLYPCPVLSKQYQKICYTYAVLERYQGDTEKGIELCGLMPREFTRECFRTLGRNTVMYSEDVAVIASQCNQIGKLEDREACLIAAAGSLLVRFELDSPLSIRLCSLLEGSGRNKCFAELGRLAQKMVAEASEAAGFCASLKEEADRSSCEGGNI